MANSYNTAGALLRAGNYDGARRIANDLLADNPDDPNAWVLIIEIEEKKKNFKQSLELIKQVLEIHPDNIALRQKELFIYIEIGKKRRARLGIERFKADFSLSKNIHEILDLLYESKFGSNKLASENIKGTACANDKFALGALETNSGALFSGQRHLQEALKDDPHNYEINAHLAFNQLALSKLWSARKAAHRALASQPTDSDMRLLISLTWWACYPPIYFYHLIITVFWLAHRWVPSWILVIVFLFTMRFIFAPINWFEAQVGQLLNFPYFGWASTTCIIGYFLSYYLFNSKLRRMLFSSVQKVRLKDY